MPKFKDGTVCKIDTTLDPDAAAFVGLDSPSIADRDSGPVEYEYTNSHGWPIYTVSPKGWSIPEQLLVPVETTSALASWEPIEYRSQPDANGDCDFIQWDGMIGKWRVLETEEVFPTPEAAAEWVAKENQR